MPISCTVVRVGDGGSDVEAFMPGGSVVDREEEKAGKTEIHCYWPDLAVFLLNYRDIWLLGSGCLSK